MCIKYITLTRNSLLMQRWLVVINSTQTRVSWEGNASIPLDRLPSSLWSVGMSRGYFLDWWLIWKDSAHCGWYWPKASDSGLCKTAGWTSRGKHVSKAYPSVTSSSIPASRCLPRVPRLPWWRTVTCKPEKPFCTQMALSSFATATESEPAQIVMNSNQPRYSLRAW